MQKWLRLFLAFPVPTDISAGIAEYREQHAEYDVRWVREENLHVTTLFIGRTDAERRAELEGIVHDIADNVHPEPITFTHIDWAPPKGKVRMLWVYGSGGGVWHDLKHRLREKLHNEKLYQDTDDHPFMPHITIARKDPVLRRELDLAHAPFEHRFVPQELLLMQSVPGENHPVYSVLDRLEF